MKTLVLSLDDDLNEALEGLCVEQGKAKEEMVTDLLRRYVEAEQLKRNLNDPNFAVLYADLADEDVSLAEQGMAEYRQIV